MIEKKQEEKIVWKDAKRVFFWYWKLTKKYSHWFGFSLAAYGIAAVTSQVYSTLILKHIVDIISASSPGWSNQLQTQIILLAGVLFLQNILFRLGDLALRKYQVPGRAHIAKYIFRIIQGHSYDFFSNTFVGSMVSKAKRFEDGFGTLSDNFIFTFWWESVVLISMLIVLTMISWPLALIFIVCIVLLFMVTVPALKERMQYDAKEGEASSKLTGYFSDTISNVLNVKVFSSAFFEIKNFNKVVNERRDIENISYKIGNKLIAIQAGLGELVGMLMIVTSIWLWSQGKVTAGTILLVVSFSQSLFHIILQFTRSTTRVLQAIANAKEMIDIFELELSVKDNANAEKLVVTEGKVQFHDIDFSYGSDKEVFSNFNFSMKSGEKVGLVGPSGGGKSTITKLLLRFMDPTSGKIYIDNQDIRLVTQDSLRRAIGYVPQEPLLFHRTLRENIAYGKLDATDEEVIEAAKKAHAHEFIETLEQGYDTMVGERGVKLSGGQRQRVAIARAILKNAPILVLDEATSALDSISELAIRDAVDKLIEEKTAIIIAHRLSTVEKMDRIIVLGKDGKISEQGTHQELVSKGGLYSELWSHQTGGFLPDDEDKAEEGVKTLEA
jgi:ATP-binding cassette subfamily B protein